MAETKQAPAAFMPIGEALVYAERCRAEGRLVEAEAVCGQVLQAQPNLAEAHHLAGVIAHQAGRLGDAILHVQRAANLAPNVALFHANLGEMLRLAGRPKKAVEEGKRATALDPSFAAAWSNLGAACYELKDFRAAEEAQRKAVAVAPQFAKAHCNLGNALYGQKRYAESIEAYRRAVALDANDPDAWANLGTALHHNGAYPEAMIALRRAVALNPEHANARSGLGILLLMHGDFAEGFAEYEWRLRSTERKGPRFPTKPWQGDSLRDKHVHVQAEQGFGDTLQFARYVPLLARRAGKVSFRVHQELATLMRESLPGIDIYGDRGEPPPFHCDFALLSLPHLFATRYETIPADLPALRAPTAAVEKWRGKLAGLPGLKVGINWGGNPEHTNDFRRSLDVADLAPLFDIPGVSIVSLQFGPRAADLRKLGGNAKKVLDLSKELGDFADTAGAVEHLDLVVSIDSSACHLAGGLGKPLWVLISRVADWRWLLRREDNPWYPSARLFREGPNADRQAVAARIGEQLRRAASGDLSVLTPFKAAQEERAAHARAIVALETARAAAPPRAEAAKAPAGHKLLVAEQKRRAGFLGDADELAREALAEEPDNAEALHSLGIISYQSGRLGEAIEQIGQAIKLAPDRALYHANVGEMLRLAGRPREAAEAARRAIALQPDYPGALSNLAIALFELGQYGEALVHLDRTLELQPEFALAHSNRGNALQKLKRFAEAEQAYRQALSLDANFADGWNNLGACLRELKRFDAAEAAYRKALALKPHDPEILDSLALALKDLDRLGEAHETFLRALAIEQRNPKIHVHHAALLLDMHRLDEAEAAASRALALNQNDHDAINMLGRAAFERGELDRALVRFRQALALKPDLADVYNNMGNVLKDLGRLKEAEDSYREALRLDPDVAGVYVNLVDSVQIARGDPLLAQMESLARREYLSDNDRLQLDFALGKAYADLKEHKSSFEHLLRGAAAKRRKLAYDEKEAFAFFDRIERVFSKKLIKEKAGGDPSSRPIFVLGMPRSGTTLVEQILASHPMVHGAGELMALHDCIAELDASGAPFPERIAALDGGGLRQLGSAYLQKLARIAPEGERVTDKMPSNYYYVGLIHLILPNAKIIHTCRDPIDNCVSCFSKLFSQEQSHTYDLGELGRYYRRYERLMTHWRKILPKGAFLDIGYEEVVEDLEGQARRILDFCRLPWDAACLEFHKTDRPVRTASASQVRQPIYRGAVGRWKAYESFLGPLLEALESGG
ncbi:tetratricopeptide repeat protein [Rhodoblastus sp.]|uniref:tetratricopeptide repeat protein n=1 Tax=Rhodoblastus sp. TaxID=1962975 RepID=UPI003F99078A